MILRARMRGPLQPARLRRAAERFDETAAAFMRLFYHHLQRGVSRAEALRLTKLRFMQSGADSRDWAAFVLTGDGLRPISTAIRWRTVMLVAFATIAIGVLLRALR